MNMVALLMPVILLVQSAAGPKFSAKLYADHESISPGGQVELAIELTVENGWHVYDPIILDTGAPTSMRFELPDDLTVDGLRFPVPALKRDHDLEYLAHEGRFYVLTTLSARAGASPGPRPMRVHVSALGCKALCVPVDVAAELTLPIRPDQPKAANEKLFEDARAALPKPLAHAPYLEGSSVSLSKDRLGPDDSAELVLSVKVKKSHQIQDRDPGTKELIATRLLIEPIDGIKLGDQQWPEPRVRTVEGFGRVRKLAGNFKIAVPLRLDDEKFPRATVPMRVLLTYQTCTDGGVCYAPEAAAAVVEFNADTPNPPLSVGSVVGTWRPVVTSLGPANYGGGHQPTGGLAWYLVLGFIGGMLLNVMPCVFPVISIKIIGFMNQAGEDRGRVLKLGLAFCAGIMVWFWVFGYLTGLGQVPLQHPPVTIGLCALFFLLAMNLFGVFEITLPGAAADALGQVASREGYVGTFFKGLLATLLGTACTAPAFAAAAAFATSQPPQIAFLIFTSAGVGMSLPYVLLSAFPGWLKKLPKPGPWMVVFKQAMGFVLIGTIVWLLTIVADQLDAQGLAWSVSLLGFLGLSVWLIGKIGHGWSTAARVTTWLAALIIAGGGVWFCLFKMYNLPAALAAPPASANTTAAPAADPAAAADAALAALAGADWSDRIPWQKWTPGLPEELARRGHTVYVDFTATWCVTCQTNKAAAVDVESTRSLMGELGVIPLKGDYTKQNDPLVPAIRQILLAHGRNSVPLNLVYAAGKPDTPEELPVIFTSGTVKDALRKAGPSRTATANPATTVPPKTGP